MVSENIAALFLLYIKPVSAISRILDRGRLWFAIVAALAASFLVHSLAPQSAQLEGLQAPPIPPPLLERALSQWIAIDPSSSFAPLGALALGYPRASVLATLVIAAIIIGRHHANIARLRAGTESRLGGKPAGHLPSS